MTNITEAMKVRKAVDEAKKLCGGCGKPWDVATAYREWDTRFGDDGHDNVGQDWGDYQHYHPECLPQRTLVHKLRDVDDLASLTFLGATIAEETRLELFKSRCYQIDNWLKEAPRDDAHWHHDDDRDEVLLDYLQAKIRFLRDFPTRDFIYWPSGWLIWYPGTWRYKYNNWLVSDPVPVIQPHPFSEFLKYFKLEPQLAPADLKLLALPAKLNKHCYNGTPPAVQSNLYHMDLDDLDKSTLTLGIETVYDRWLADPKKSVVNLSLNPQLTQDFIDDHPEVPWRPVLFLYNPYFAWDFQNSDGWSKTCTCPKYWEDFYARGGDSGIDGYH